jgi:hypothetical protein
MVYWKQSQPQEVTMKDDAVSDSEKRQDVCKCGYLKEECECPIPAEEPDEEEEETAVLCRSAQCGHVWMAGPPEDPKETVYAEDEEQLSWNWPPTT